MKPNCHCINCSKWSPYVDDSLGTPLPQDTVKRLDEQQEVTRIPDNCCTWLCNDGSCPHEKSICTTTTQIA